METEGDSAPDAIDGAVAVEWAQWSKAQQWGELASPVTDVDPAWIHELVESIRAVPLDAADADCGLSPDLITAIVGSELPDQGAEVAQAARGLLALTAGMEKLIGWAQAQQMRALAALARPGVVVPIGEVLDAVTNGGTSGPNGAGSADELLTLDLAATRLEQLSVADRPEWNGAVTDQAARFAATELAAALRFSSITASVRVQEALDLADGLPAVLRLLETGRLDRPRARALADRTADLPAASRAAVADALLADGGQAVRAATPAALRPRVDRLAARLDPEAVARRRERARADRNVFVSPGEEGISRFCADVAAPVALLAREVIDTVARSLPPERSICQRRADVFADLFTQLAAHGTADIRYGATGTTDTDEEAAASTDLLPTGWEALGTSVTVVVDAATLHSADPNDPAALENAIVRAHPGLPPDLARTLALSARRARIAVRNPAEHPLMRSGGGALELGDWTYRPSGRLAEQVRLRDRTCRFPGCRRAAEGCDLDHRVPFDQGGPTTAGNLDALCRTHHRTKTFTRWRAVRAPEGRMVWSSPLGLVHHDDPEHDDPDHSRRTPPY